MPLPAALAARLKKRGLLKEDAQSAEPEEEIIAEDYSGEAEEPAEESKENELQILLNNTNLPPGWWKVKDPISRNTYFWDSETDQVSWRHPLDKDAVITFCAERLKKMEEDDEEEDDDVPDQIVPPSTDIKETEEVNPFRVMPMVGPMEPPKEPPPRSSHRDRERERDRSSHERRRRERDSRRRKHKEDELDPMDPAAYSEVPRGTWSTGLLQKSNEAKTGVDVTANGPLFQMRPYPSPGAILRANAKSTDKEGEDD